MKQILMLLFVSTFFFLGLVHANFNSTKDQTKVYICTGGSSKSYHKYPKCTGLSRCSKEVKEITLEQAINMNRVPCKICHK